MRQTVDLAQRVARVDSTLVIQGEAGAGKELVARLVHDNSVRATGPFIVVRCGAIAETLLRSELFGHARDAFPGASDHRPGVFETANRGTLVLKETTDLSLALHDELHRALAERTLRRLGDDTVRHFDVRVILATKEEPTERLAPRTTPPALPKELEVLELRVPPLRERRADVLPLARLILAQAREETQRRLTGLAPEVAEQLLRYDWPGNVRELETVLEQAVGVARGAAIALQDLPGEVRLALPGAGPLVNVRPLEDVEKDYIIASLRFNGGNQTQTAEQLRIGSATLYRKLKSYGVIRAKPAEENGSDGEVL